MTPCLPRSSVPCPLPCPTTIQYMQRRMRTSQGKGGMYSAMYKIASCTKAASCCVWLCSVTGGKATDVWARYLRRYSQLVRCIVSSLIVADLMTRETPEMICQICERVIPESASPEALMLLPLRSFLRQHQRPSFEVSRRLARVFSMDSDGKEHCHPLPTRASRRIGIHHHADSTTNTRIQWHPEFCAPRNPLACERIKDVLSG